MRKIKPDVIGIYIVTQTFKETCSVAKLIKSEYRDTLIIIGGYHITALPHTLPKVFDIGVFGEREETMRELMEIIAKYGIGSDKISTVNGIAFRKNGDVIITEERLFIDDLDILACAAHMPAYELLPLKRYHRPFFGNYTL